jgi:hypothetical protein
MIQEAIKQLWRARTRSEASNALDMLESGLDGDWDDLSAIEFESIMDLIRVKGSQLTH